MENCRRIGDREYISTQEDALNQKTRELRLTTPSFQAAQAALQALKQNPALLDEGSSLDLKELGRWEIRSKGESLGTLLKGALFQRNSLIRKENWRRLKARVCNSFTRFNQSSLQDKCKTVARIALKKPLELCFAPITKLIFPVIRAIKDLFTKRVKNINKFIPNLLHKKKSLSHFFHECKLVPIDRIAQKHAQTESKKNCFPEQEEALQAKQLLDPSRVPFKTDPFTHLATIAFQKYEPHFFHKDPGLSRQLIKQTGKCLTSKKKYKPLLQSRCRIVCQEGKWVLKERKTQDKGSLEENRAAVREYLDFCNGEYGAKKVREVTSYYKIDFDQMLKRGDPLTPEHIYRMNMGVNHIEAEDLIELSNKIAAMPPAFAKDETDRPLSDFTQELYQWGFSRRELFGITRQLPSNRENRQPTVGEFIEWIKGMQTSAQSLCKRAEETPNQIYSHLPHLIEREKSNQLIEVYQIPQEDREALFTGRKIHHTLTSGYTGADKREFKPWLDQQNCLQAFSELQQASGFAWEETLTHVLVKQQLIQPNQEGEWKVGTLIPAPNEPDGKKRWMQVTSFSDNQRGDVHYTLEPVGSSSHSPTVILCRSTASKPYQTSSTDSIGSDISMYPPGYSGKGRADYHELPFYQDRTLPLWVAYASRQATSLREKSIDLTASKEQLREILQQMEKEWEQLQGGRDWKKVVQRPKKQNDPREYFNALMRLASFLDPRALRNCLAREIQAWDQGNRVFPSNETLETIENAKENLKKFIIEQKKHIEEATDLNAMQEANSHFLTFARTLGEHPDQKISTSLHFQGHSLGGALAQQKLVHCLIDQNRIPLQGQNCVVHAFDGPGIAKRDARKFEAYLNRHEELLSHFNAPWQLNLHFEDRDFVPLGGEKHLGSYQERERNCLQFNAVVRKSKAESSNQQMYDAKIAHSTRFGYAKKEIDFTEKKLSARELCNLHSWGRAGACVRKKMGLTLYGEKFLASLLIPFGTALKKAFFSPAWSISQEIRGRRMRALRKWGCIKLGAPFSPYQEKCR